VRYQDAVDRAELLDGAVDDRGGVLLQVQAHAWCLLVEQGAYRLADDSWESRIALNEMLFGAIEQTW